MKSTDFNSTPSTLLVDRDWRIVWVAMGVMEKDDHQQALRAMDTLPIDRASPIH